MEYAAQKIYGYTLEDMIGNPISILIPPNLSDDLFNIMEKIKTGESINHYDTKRVRKNGKLIDVSLHISPIYGPNGNVQGYLLL